MKTIRSTVNWDDFDALLSNAVEGFTVAEYAARQGTSFSNAHGKLEIARAQGKLVRQRDGGVFKYRAAPKGEKR